MDTQKKKFCLVGFGNHAKNKLLPSLEKQDHKILGIVSTKKLKLKYKIFDNLKIAIKSSNIDTFF